MPSNATKLFALFAKLPSSGIILALTSLKGASLPYLGIITYQADKINYNLISELAGFGDGGIIEDKNSFSYKKVSRKDINIKDLEIDFDMSNSTIKRHLKRLEKS